jgi:hypothetical protein
MRNWWRQASDAAAISFGFRHSGLFAGLHAAGGVLSGLWWLTRYVVAPLALVAGAVALGWYLWQFGARHVSASMLMTAGIILAAAVLLAILARPVYRWWRRWRYGYYW